MTPLELAIFRRDSPGLAEARFPASAGKPRRTRIAGYPRDPRPPPGWSAVEHRGVFRMAGRIARHELAFRDDARASFPERLEDAACELRADALPGKLRRHLGVEKNDAAALGLVVGDRERVAD